MRGKGRGRGRGRGRRWRRGRCAPSSAFALDIRSGLRFPLTLGAEDERRGGDGVKVPAKARRVTGVGATSLMRWDGFGGFCSSSRPVPPSGYITYRAAVPSFSPPPSMAYLACRLSSSSSFSRSLRPFVNHCSLTTASLTTRRFNIRNMGFQRKLASGSGRVSFYAPAPAEGTAQMGQG